MDVEGENLQLHAGTKLIGIDFRLERMQIDMERKRTLLRAFNDQGFIGDIDNEAFVFCGKGRPIRKPTTAEIDSLPHLPDDWYDTAMIVEDV